MDGGAKYPIWYVNVDLWILFQIYSQHDTLIVR